MKKILTFVLAAVVASAGLFAFDLGGIEGTWQDTKYNANWKFNAGGSITLSDASTGKVYYTFTDANTQNFKVNAGASGVTVTFDCQATSRSYKFVKGISLSSDLTMEIDPTWTSENYSTTIKFQGGKADVQ